MRSIAFVTAVSLTSPLAVGCAATTSTGPTTPSAETQEREATRVREQAIAQDRERELRARLALAEARAAELQGPPRDTVRIGSAAPTENESSASYFEDDGGDWDEPSEHLPDAPARSERGARADNGPRPVLRLYGVPQPDPSMALPYATAYPPVAPIPAAPVPVAMAPAAPAVHPVDMSAPSVTPTNDRLPWEAAPIAASATTTAEPAQPVAGPRRVDMGLEGYGRALELFQERRFAESFTAFERFLAVHPNHPRAAHARYWRAEALYVQRRYARARTAFRDYLDRHPSGAKAADAVFKVALCNRRLGDEDGAERELARLRRDYPGSGAARLAARQERGQ